MQAGKDDGGAINDINVTPLVDISLVLVIIFMVTSPMLVQSGILVSSSKTTASEGKHTKDESVQMNLTKKGVFVNNQLAADDAQLLALLKQRLANNKEKLVVVTSTREVLHGVMVRSLDVAKQAGAVKLAIMRDDKINVK